MRKLHVMIAAVGVSASLSAAESSRLYIQSTEDCYADLLVLATRPVAGVAAGIEHEGTGVLLLDILRGEAIQEAEFVTGSIFADGRTGGSVTAILSFGAPIRSLPASEAPYRIARFFYGTEGDPTTGTMRIAAPVGDSPVTTVEGDAGRPMTPEELTVDRTPIEVAVPCPATGEVPFNRGDANQDGAVNISDGVTIVRSVYGLTGDRGCPDALDSNDDEKVDAADGIYLLNYLFLGGPAVFPPHAIRSADGCGSDPGGAGPLRCFRFEACP